MVGYEGVHSEVDAVQEIPTGETQAKGEDNVDDLLLQMRQSGRLRSKESDVFLCLLCLEGLMYQAFRKACLVQKRVVVNKGKRVCILQVLISNTYWCFRISLFFLLMVLILIT